MQHGAGRLRLAVLAAAAAAAVALACAQPGSPPGGPPDAELPVLLKVLPDSNAVNVRTPAVVLQFDEVINERSSGAGSPPASGGSSLATVVVISPSDGRDEVIWRRNVIELRPRRGFRPNTTYRVTVLPGLSDLRGNRSEAPFDFVFSTGPTIPPGEIRGVLFDWTTGKVATNARVEIFLAADSTFRWATRTDSAGRFVLRDLGPETYQLRAWVDGNNDRRISFREISDTAQVTLVDTASLELYAYGRDTLPPRIEVVELIDSTGIRVRFDRGILLDWNGEGATLLRADSSVVPLGGVFVPSPRFDSLARQRRATADSAARAAADTLPADSVRADSLSADSVRADPLSADPSRADSVASDSTAAADSAAADTLPPAPVFRRQVPEVNWSAPLSAPLPPGSYRLRITRATGLNGRSVDAEREIRVREPVAPPVKSDSTVTRP